MSLPGLGWGGIVRLGLVKTALGAIIVLTTSTLNRVMVVEYALPAMLPGFLVALHHFIQMSRPLFGHGSDVGGRRTPWIVGGIAVLATGGALASVGTALMSVNTTLGTATAVFAFVLIGVGAGAGGTSLLALLAKLVHPDRRTAAATIVWVMMIAGFAVTAGIAGHFLDPFSVTRLVVVTSSVSGAALLLTLVSLYGLEDAATRAASAKAPPPPGTFRDALQKLWHEPQARRFTIFVFVSMLAYSTQDLILEPFAGTVFAMTPGESTKLSGVQHSGVLLGMIVVAVTGTLMHRDKGRLLRQWAVGGCVASALALLLIAAGGMSGPDWPLGLTVFALGAANGAFAVGAIGTMMTLAGQGGERREGLRMGLWGAAQAIAMGLGGFLGTVAIDLTRALFENPALAYGLVFSVEAALFLVAAAIGASVRHVESGEAQGQAILFGDAELAELAGSR
jgi:BCD family chlorophyll transporter-like MFS transporter